MADRVSGGDCAMAYRAGVKRLLSMEWLPAPIGVLAEVIEELENWTGDSALLEGRINRDPSLTAQVLKVANSAYYGCQQEVGTLSRALVVIGVKEVRNICISVALIQQFHGLKPSLRFDRRRFWLHSFAVAQFSSFLASDLELECADSAYVVGLLHDIGRLVMAYHLPEVFDEISDVPAGISPYEYEKELCLSHAEVGYWLCRKWRLPPLSWEVTRWHHEPFEANKFPLEAALVHVAATAVKFCEAGCPQGELDLPSEAVLERLGIGQGRFMLYLEEADNCLERANEVLNALFVE